MLWSLCTLATALTYVSAVTQEPPVLTLRRGETASMHCHLGRIDAVRWYKMVPEVAPKCLFYMYFERSSPVYCPEVLSSKYTSTHQSKSDYSLIIKNVDVGDSAVYYCSTWSGHGEEYVTQWCTV